MNNGWGVILTDTESTNAVTTELCTTINNESIPSMKNMFNSSQAATGYARTQTDADKFNTSLNKPSTLTFIVKP